jgi:hypothetical protein
MENEYIVLLDFNAINDGVDFMQNINTPFSFMVNDIAYDYLGNVIQTPVEYDLYSLNQIYLDIHEVPSPGVLYVSDGFLKYYKETNL